jgi:host factor-I protein
VQQELSLNRQDDYLLELSANQSVVTFILKSGVPIQGIIRAFDSFVVLIEDRGKQQMVYKHAISTLLQGKLPSRTVPSKNNGSIQRK